MQPARDVRRAGGAGPSGNPTSQVGLLSLSSPDRSIPEEVPMPSAIPADAAANLPPAGMIDPRGHRFGAGLSAVLLVLSFVANQPLGVALVLLSIGTSAALGLRYSIYGAIWRRLARALRLPKAEPEHEY